MVCLRNIWGILLLGCFSSNAQLAVDTTRTEEFLVKEILLGKGVLVGEISYTGPSFAIAHFKDDLKTIGLSEGILLTSGNVYYSLGPNRSPRTGWASNAPGDADLDKITRGRTHDAAVLEFDFITQSENLSFQFVFASEEYQEYVGSKFNDVFGFFLTGPNADGVNLALLPDGKTPITINNVNHESGKAYYVDNFYYNTSDPFIWDVRKRKVVKNKKYMKETKMPEHDIQYDGFTVVLTARYKVMPNEIYRIKLAVADVADGILDSGVFLAAGSFQSEGDKVDITKQFIIRETQSSNQNITIVPRAIESTRQDTASVAEWIRPEVANVEFAFDSYQISDTSYSILHIVSELMLREQDLYLDVVGHTDSKGAENYNLELSRNRSETVIKHLLELGVNKRRITSNYLGEVKPVSTNNSNDGRARNRRVEFILKKNIASLN